MIHLARAAMRGPQSAGVWVALAGVLGLLLLPLLYLAGALLALVALQAGLPRALRVAALPALAVVLVDRFIGTGAAPLALLVVWGPLLAAGALVGARASLADGLLLLGALGAGGVAATYVLVENPTAQWQDALQRFIEVAEPDDPAALNALVPELASLMTGAVTAAFVLAGAGALTLARHWQAALYRPGAFAAEFRRLRLGRVIATALLGVAVLAAAGGERATNILMPLAAVSLFQGLAVCHAVVPAARWRTGALGVVYILMAVLPQWALLVSLLGAADNWLNVRRRLGGSGPAA